MSLENERTYTLLQLSTKVCRHCENFKQYSCPSVQMLTDQEFKKFSWSSLTICEKWKPTAITEEALEYLTWRKLEGKEIEYPKPEEDIDEFIKCLEDAQRSLKDLSKK